MRGSYHCEDFGECRSAEDAIMVTSALVALGSLVAMIGGLLYVSWRDFASKRHRPPSAAFE